MKNNNKGFTLVELLAVLALLSIVTTIFIYSATNIIKNTKEKGYEVTINNIEYDANSYVLEEISKTRWLNGANNSYQYQCVTVQNLIDAGYFKNDILDSYVSEDRKVLANDNIYLERDINTKAIIRNVLILDDRDYGYKNLCLSFNPVGDINFNVTPSGWAREKSVTVNYDLYNVDRVSNYTYGYDYRIKEDVSYVNYFKSNSEMEQINNITDNIGITAYVLKNGESFISKTYYVSDIDNISPEIEFSNDGSGDNWVKSASSKITVSDTGSGIDNSSLKYVFYDNVPENVENIFTNNDDESINSFTDGGEVAFSVKEGKYYLIAYACDKVGNCTTKVSDEFNIDMVKPELAITNPYDGIWYNSIDLSNGKSYVLTLNVSDNASGINSYYYSYNEDASKDEDILEVCDDTNKCWWKYNKIYEEITLKDTYYPSAFTAERNQNVYIRVCDNAGNCTEQETLIMIDNTEPTLTINYPESIPKDTWFNKAKYEADWDSYVLTLNSSDEGSGIDYYAYDSTSTSDFVSYDYCDGKNQCVTTPWSAERNENVKIKVCDNAGNCNTQETPIKIDINAPKIDGCYKSGFVTKNDEGEDEEMRRVFIGIWDIGGSGLVYDETNTNLLVVSGTYAHSITGCGTSGVFEKFVRSSADSTNYYQNFRCSGNSSNVLTMKPTVCDNAGNCSNSEIEVTYGDYHTNERWCDNTSKQ